VAIVERVRKRDGIRTYYIDFRDQKGRRVREIAGTTRKQAKDLLTQRLGEVRAGTYVNSRDVEVDRGPTFEEFASRFLREHPGARRSNHYPTVMKRMSPYFEGVPIREISRADLDRFRVRLLTEPVPKLGRPLSTTSVLKILRTMHRVLKVAVRWGVIETNPASEMEKPPARKPKTRFLTLEEFQRVEGVALDWLRPMLRMAVATAMRLKEVVGLRWEDVDRNAGLIHVTEDSKTGRRVVPMPDAVRQILARQVRHVLSPMVFVNAAGRDYTSEAARMWISQATKRAMRKAGIEDATFHSLRHTAAAWMVQGGATLFEVQSILGHSTPVMTQLYAHLQPDHLRKAVRALDRKLNSSKPRSTSKKASE
jgi:integrase